MATALGPGEPGLRLANAHGNHVADVDCVTNDLSQRLSRIIGIEQGEENVPTLSVWPAGLASFHPDGIEGFSAIEAFADQFAPRELRDREVQRSVLRCQSWILHFLVGAIEKALQRA